MSDITMYGADWCRDCRRAKAYLQTNGIPFVYIDVEAQPEQMATVVDRNGGRTSIPVIVFGDGTHLTEPTDEQLGAKLAELAT